MAIEVMKKTIDPEKGDTTFAMYAHPLEGTAKKMAMIQAVAEHEKKHGAGTPYKVLSDKMFQNKGKYEAEVTLVKDKNQ